MQLLLCSVLPAAALIKWFMSYVVQARAKLVDLQFQANRIASRFQQGQDISIAGVQVSCVLSASAAAQGLSCLMVRVLDVISCRRC